MAATVSGEIKPPENCLRCGRVFACGSGTGTCWCNDLPDLPPTLFNRDDPRCYCPECLRIVLKEAGAKV
jgi:hypothetical protein